MTEPKQISQQFTQASPVIASYNYTDIAEGTGVVLFYGSNDRDDGGYTYFLTNNTTRSAEIDTHANVTSTSYTKRLDLHFDLSPFNSPRKIKGKTRYVFTMTGRGGENSASMAYIIFKLKKWDGTTETQIGNVTSVEGSLGTSGNVVGSHEFTCEIDVTSQVHFKKGDVLRVTAEVWGKLVATGGTGRVGIAHDPTDRDNSGLLLDEHSSQLKIYIPFMIEI